MDTSNVIGTIFCCVITILVVGALIAVGVFIPRWLKARRHIHALEEKIMELQEKHAAEISGLQEEHAAEINELREKHKEEIEKYAAEISKLQEKAKERFLMEWLHEVMTVRYRNEIEVEVKFIYPLLRFLGYRNEQIRVRENVSILVGSEERSIEADWAVYSMDSRPILVIEAKAPETPLDNRMIKQTRSYAFALGAPLYLLTNGKELRIFEYGVSGDRCLFSSFVGNLSQNWSALTEILAADKWSTQGGI